MCIRDRVLAVSFAVSLATVLAVSLAAFFAVLFASFFPASTFLIRFFASTAAFFLKSAAPLEAVPVTGRLDSYARSVSYTHLPQDCKEAGNRCHP